MIIDSNGPKYEVIFEDYDEEFQEEYEALDQYEQDIVAEYWEELGTDDSPRYIIDHCIWSGDIDSFINELLNESLNPNVKIPDWVHIDYDKTWDYLSPDFSATTNYIFSV